MNLIDIPSIVPNTHGARRVNLLDGAVAKMQIVPPKITQEPVMPRGIYDRKPRGPKVDAPKKKAAPPVAKTRGQYADVLAELHAKRDQLDAAIKAIELL